MSYDEAEKAKGGAMGGVLGELRRKRGEAQRRFESVWNRLAIVECKKKAGWQDFNLAEKTAESQRKGRFVRIQFVDNFACNIEHYNRFVVQQIAFIGIQYDE